MKDIISHLPYPSPAPTLNLSTTSSILVILMCTILNAIPETSALTHPQF